MADETAFPGDLFDDMHSMRVHARRARAADAAAAGLAALLSLGGAAVFLVSTQITSVACQAPGTCSAESVGFNGWAYWVIGGGVASVLVALLRHVRGVHRARATRMAGRSVMFLIVAAVAALFAGYGTTTVGGWDEPWLFPAAALAVVGALAARRRDMSAAITCAAVSLGIVAAGMRTKIAFGPVWWFEHNAGLAMSAAVAGLIASVLAWRWYRQDSV